MIEPNQTTTEASAPAEVAQDYRAIAERAVDEISRAYCDCYRTDANIYRERNLHFRCSVELSPPEVYEVMTRYVPGYNAFTPELVLNLPGDAAVRVAREGSVCLYVRTAADLSAQADELKADELDQSEPGVWRIWWD
jgi:hypothetical protein